MLSEADADVLAERRLRAAELALVGARQELEQARLLAIELTGRIRSLDAELQDARSDAADLRSELGAAHGRRRAAEQRAYSERVYREQLQDTLAEADRHRQDTGDALDRLGDARTRIGELEAELAELGRTADELEHQSAAAASARRGAEARAGQLQERLARLGMEQVSRPQLEAGRGARLRAELSLAARQPRRPRKPRERVPPPDSIARQLRHERALVGIHSARALAPAERDAPAALPVAGAPAQWRATLTQLRHELRTLSSIAEGERAARIQSDARAAKLERSLSEQAERNAQAFESIETLRRGLAAPAAPGPGYPATLHLSRPDGARGAPAGASVAVAPERLSAALSRLREATPTISDTKTGASPSDRGAQAPPLATQPWLPGVFRGLARRDPAAAGELLVALLPAQRLVHSQPLAYDICLAEDRCMRVTIDRCGGERVEAAQESRRIDRISFRVVGDAERLGRLLGSGAVGRRLGPRRARVEGDRRSLRVLDDLLRAPLALGQLRSLGIELAPELTLKLVAEMIEPGWTHGARFVLAHQVPVPNGAMTCLSIRDGERAAVGGLALGGTLTCRLRCDAEMLPALLDGSAELAGELEGESTPLHQIRRWCKLAQSG